MYYNKTAELDLNLLSRSMVFLSVELIQDFSTRSIDFPLGRLEYSFMTSGWPPLGKLVDNGDTPVLSCGESGSIIILLKASFAYFNTALQSKGQ